MQRRLLPLAIMCAIGIAACEGDDGRDGAQGPAGAAGPAGPAGPTGPAGPAGTPGTPATGNLTVTTDIPALGVTPCLSGTVITQSGPDTNANGTLDASEITSTSTTCGTAQAPAPMSSLVAARLVDTGSANIPDYVKSLVDSYAATGVQPLSGSFPLSNNITDANREIPGLASNVVASWFDPLTADADGPRYGSNNDYMAYFGDGWDSDWAGGVVGSAPQFNGAANAGWMWVNFEYISNGEPAVNLAPTGQNLSLAVQLVNEGILDFDVTDAAEWTDARVDTFIDYAKQNVGGGWFRVSQAGNGEWNLERNPNAKRYDGTSTMLASVTGFTLSEPDIDDAGNPLAAQTVAGVLGNCSGGTTPWGTIITAEENVQSYYGDLEDAWTSRLTFIPGTNWGAGAAVTLPYSPVAPGEANFTKSNAALNHNREVYGFLTEIDPDAATDVAYASFAGGGSGVGHRKIGSMGRARWENATLAVDTDYELVPGQPVVIYGGNDRRGGGIYKWVSAGNYTAGMTEPEVRALLDDGTLYIAHFADLDNRTGYTLVPGAGSAPPAIDPNCAAGVEISEATMSNKADVFAAGCVSPTQTNFGSGQWIELSLASTDIAPNAGTAAGAAATTVGAALADNSWNQIGSFATENDVLAATFTAAMKIGIRELNRPEDLEWNPVDGNIYIAFTSHGRPTALNDDGSLRDDGMGNLGGIANVLERRDDEGAVFAMREADPANPGASNTFTFWAAWQGRRGPGLFDAENPDNIVIDEDGGVWFGTDGNYSESRNTTDALYYLDQDPTHTVANGAALDTFGLAFRVIGGPSDSEATGPTFNSDMTTVFYNAQHPGEFVSSQFPF